MKKFMDALFTVVIFYVVAAASFNGFFVIYAFMEKHDNRRSFEEMYDETAHRPFVYRQLMIKISKEIRNELPQDFQNALMQEFKRSDIIREHYAQSEINPAHAIEYHLLYFMCFGCLLFSMFLWRDIGVEITENVLAGKLTACIFALIFPLFEWLGVFYDCSEVFFFSLAALFACRGNWLALIILTPIASYNKESFLFFILALYPLLESKIGRKKAAPVIIFSAFLSGCVYLYQSAIYAGNPGGTVEWHFYDHLRDFTILRSWMFSQQFYGVYWGVGFFLPNVFMIAWLVKCTWKKIPAPWKNHMKIALTINLPLFVLFCYPNEIRNFSLLYVSFIVILSIYIKEAIDFET